MPLAYLTVSQHIEISRCFLQAGVARSLLISGRGSLPEAAPRVQCDVRTSSKRVFPERAAEARAA